MKTNYRVNNKKKATGRRRFKCLDCGQRFGEYDQLVKHAQKYHEDLIDGEDVHMYLYDKRNTGDGLCIICHKNHREWDPVKRKRNRFCNNPECRKKAREEFRKNMIKVYKTDNLLNDPERQAAMLANRHISGKFKFPDGVEIVYTGKYELDFLEYAIKKGFTSEDIIDPPRSTYTEYWDSIHQRKRIYIPDFYMPRFKLIIEIKDGSKYPIESKAKMIMKEEAIIKRNEYNFIKIVDKQYEDFDKLIETLSQKNYVEIDNDDPIFIIPNSYDELYKIAKISPYGQEDLGENYREYDLSKDLIQKYKLSHIRKNTFGTIITTDKDDKFVGVIACEQKSNNEIWIQGLEVAPEFQGKGIGKYLLTLSREKHKATRLSVRQNNHNAIKLYKKDGWKIYKTDKYMYYMSHK